MNIVLKHLMFPSVEAKGVLVVIFYENCLGRECSCLFLFGDVTGGGKNKLWKQIVDAQVWPEPVLLLFYGL